MVLPFFGPSTVRDTFALPADDYFSLPNVFREARDANGARALTVVHTRARLLDASDLMSDVALDKYAFVRDAYLQRRQNLIYNGEPPDEDLSLWQQPDIMGMPLAARALPASALMWSAGGARSVAPGVKVASLGSDLPVLPLVPSLSGPTDEELAGLRAAPELR
jgi:phospholipid-binding lipoprotein MlaA